MYKISRGARAQVCDKNFVTWLWVRSLFGAMRYLFKFIFLFLRSSVEADAISPEFCVKWGSVVVISRGIQREADLFIFIYYQIY